VPRLLTDLDGRAAALLAGLIAAVVALWDTPVVYPLKILVVFFHEMSHGLTAILTGGSILEIRVVAQEGGLAVTQGGSRFLILTSGYLGSLVVGGIILIVAARTRYDRALSIALGTILAGVTLFFVRPLLSFGFGFGAAAALVLVLIGLKLPEKVNDIMLRVVGLTSCMYAVLDIKSDVLDRPGLQSDARMLSDLTLLPTLFWGILWFGIALAASVILLLIACQKGPPIAPTRPPGDSASPVR
jgi:hypothetical protein